ncbi:nitroreductase family protein [Garciella nitratireducens]|uniref:Nitroreductase n=1 Tax=Garciella nitratireducens DSM 15102 TaxID=1121911 RepID=A0A1T4NP84_9FIRM|nr:nitroreductase family protein [Garciella nitratireducens]SJZ81023.1 Nitroreductase [Garciella nitratireducens DSM 15102]
MLDLLKTRRSIRKFQSREVEEEKIQELLKGALMAPSSKNKKPWELIILKDKEKLREVSQCRGKISAFIEKAAFGIVVVVDPETSDVWIEDASIIATILHLQAHSLGLGSCWIQVRNREMSEGESAEEYLKKILSIPQKYRIECMIALGYPAEEKKPHDEEKLCYEKIHKNSF